MIESEEFKLMKMNLGIHCKKYEIREWTKKFHKMLKKLIKKSKPIFQLNVTKIREKNDNLKYCIIDFECTEPKFLGLLLRNNLYQIYIVKPEYQLCFYEAVLNVLYKLKDFYLFSWGDWERRVILSMRSKLEDIKKAKNLHFIDELSLFNLQERNYESLEAALISIGRKPAKELFFRDARFIDHAYYEGYLEPILEHNSNCLISALIMLKYRWLKKNLV